MSDPTRPLHAAVVRHAMATCLRCGAARWRSERRTRTTAVRVTARRVGAPHSIATIHQRPPGSDVPPLAHWMFFLPLARQSTLGPDGHPSRGGFLPPIDLPRRMWAGGRLQFLQPLQVGDAITRTSRIAERRCQERQQRRARLRDGAARDRLPARGRDHRGARHRLPRCSAARRGGARTACRRDQRDLLAHASCPTPCCCSAIRRSPSTATASTTTAATSPRSRAIPGLIVHGPLIATLLMDLLRRERPRAVVDAFRVHRQVAAVRPAPVRRLRPPRRRAATSCCGRATTRVRWPCRPLRNSRDACDRDHVDEHRPIPRRDSAMRCARCARSFPTSTTARSTPSAPTPRRSSMRSPRPAGWPR